MTEAENAQSSLADGNGNILSLLYSHGNHNVYV